MTDATREREIWHARPGYEGTYWTSTWGRTKSPAERVTPDVSVAGAPERWRSVPGYEDSYEASDLGQVRSLDQTIVRKDGKSRRVRSRVLKQATRKQHGYRVVTLSRRRSRKARFVHQLILESFLGPRPLGMFALHNNDVPADNRLSNLRWDTPSSNNLDTVAHGMHRGANKIRCLRGHLLAGPNLRASVSEEGRRGCLACQRARDIARYRRRQGIHCDLDRLSEAYYVAIMGLSVQVTFPD